MFLTESAAISQQFKPSSFNVLLTNKNLLSQDIPLAVILLLPTSSTSSVVLNLRALLIFLKLSVDKLFPTKINVFNLVLLFRLDEIAKISWSDKSQYLKSNSVVSAFFRIFA